MSLCAPTWQLRAAVQRLGPASSSPAAGTSATYRRPEHRPAPPDSAPDQDRPQPPAAGPTSRLPALSYRPAHPPVAAAPGPNRPGAPAERLVLSPLPFARRAARRVLGPLRYNVPFSSRSSSP